MSPAGGVVLALSVLFLGLALLALLGRAERSRLVAAWVAMAGFAGLASFCFWKGVELKRSGTPVYYDLPSSPAGLQRVTLHRPGSAPGFRGRLVHRPDRSFDKARGIQLESCGWRIPICENLAYTVWTFNEDGVFEFQSEYSDVVLQYEATAETRALLEQTALEVTCPAGFRKGLGQGLQMMRVRMAVFLGGLLLAAVGAGVQRRRQERLKNPVNVPS